MACGVKASRIASTAIGNIHSRYLDFMAHPVRQRFSAPQYSSRLSFSPFFPFSLSLINRGLSVL
jgi:hypothetical protein